MTSAPPITDVLVPAPTEVAADVPLTSLNEYRRFLKETVDKRPTNASLSGINTLSSYTDNPYYDEKDDYGPIRYVARTLDAILDNLEHKMPQMATTEAKEKIRNESGISTIQKSLFEGFSMASTANRMTPFYSDFALLVAGPSPLEEEKRLDAQFQKMKLEEKTTTTTTMVKTEATGQSRKKPKRRWVPRRKPSTDCLGMKLFP